MWDEKGLFKILQFYNTFIEKPEIKKLNNAELLKELPFHDHLSIVKNKTGFTGYARRHKIEVVQKIDVITQLKPGEVNIKDLFKDLLHELKGFKYQINLKILLSKIENNGEIEYSPVCFNSLTKAVINNDYKLDQAFEEIIYRLDNWISHESGWVVEETHNKYLNVSSYSPLVGITYISIQKKD